MQIHMLLFPPYSCTRRWTAKGTWRSCTSCSLLPPLNTHQTLIHMLPLPAPQLHQALDDYLDMAQLRIRLRKGLPHKTVRLR